MQKLFCITLSFLFICGLGLFSMKAANPVTGLNHKYGICLSSEDSSDIVNSNGSYIQFKIKVGVGAVYDYFINGGQHNTGRVESYHEKEGEKQYVLEGFFNNTANACFRIVDMPNCDNLKAAVLYYANQKEDPSTTYLQYILIDEDFEQIPTENITN